MSAGLAPWCRRKVLGETALLCRVTGRLLADDPSLARSEGLGAAQARLADALTRALDPHHAALAVAADPHCRGREAFPFALLGDLDTGHRSVARDLLDLDERRAGRRARPVRPARAGLAARAGRGLLGPRRAARLGARPRRRPAARRAHRRLRPHPRRAARHRLRPAPAPQRPPGQLRRRRRGGPARCRARERQPRRRRRAALDLADARPAAQPRCPLRPRRARPGRGHPRLPARPRARRRRRRRSQPRPTARPTSSRRATTRPSSGRSSPPPCCAPPTRRPPSPGRRSAPTAPTPDADPLPLLVLADGPWADALRTPPARRAGGLHRAAARRRAAHRRRAARPGAGARRRGLGGRPRAGRTCRRSRQGAALLSRVARVVAQPVTLAC